ncbi:hypothetical protein [Klebsiella oxytoca]|uniref:LuxR family transcriptional regulator n=1 Tax=Klebsiella oxytoca TaxID=571 RepID=A0A6B8MN12_KLEOX|nr:hypothetical protein [Klebsiella oxytoca]QGN36129.1 hypothetical protein GJ746_01890 [Klebsiella oxytoca]
MNYHFISDDSFFMSSVRILYDKKDVKSFFHNINEESKLFFPQPGDVVVVVVNNVLQRSRIIKNPMLLRCRLIVIMDIPMIPSRLDYFPWLLPKNISIEAFLAVMQKAVRSVIYRGEVSCKTLRMFEDLCNGKSASRLSGEVGIPIKSVYRIKQNIFREYGLLNCNSVGILLCRDILSMKVPI